MKDITVRQLEMANRVVGFLQTNPIAFREDSPGADLVEQLSRQASEIQRLTAAQATEIAEARANSRARGAARESLKESMAKIRRTAHGMAHSLPAMAAKFEAGRGVGDARLETQARSLAETARPYVQEFVRFELEPTFLSELEGKTKAFVQAIAGHKASRTAHAATSQLINAAMEQALTILEQLDPIIENKLEGNATLRLQWENVRHIEKRWIYRPAA